MTQGDEVQNYIHPVEVDTSFRNKVVVTIEGQDWQRDLEAVGLTFDSNEREIMTALAPLIREEFGVDITDYYKVRKATNTGNIYVIPSSTAGSM